MHAQTLSMQRRVKNHSEDSGLFEIRACCHADMHSLHTQPNGERQHYGQTSLERQYAGSPRVMLENVAIAALLH